MSDQVKELSAHLMAHQGLVNELLQSNVSLRANNILIQEKHKELNEQLSAANAKVEALEREERIAIALDEPDAA